MNKWTQTSTAASSATNTVEAGKAYVTSSKTVVGDGTAFDEFTRDPNDTTDADEFLTANPIPVGAYFGKRKSVYGKTWSTFGQCLDPITQDSCAFYEHHDVFKQYSGLVLETSEGDEIAKLLSNKKALILQNHGLLTVGSFVESAAWWFITMERSCQAQLMANSVNGKDIKKISNDAARKAFDIIGNEEAGWFGFQPLLQKIIKKYPELK